MKKIHIDDYAARFTAFLKEHGEYEERRAKYDDGDESKEITFKDGAFWNEYRNAGGAVEFWNSEDNESKAVDVGAENAWLNLGGGFTVNLNERYSKSFKYAFFHITKNGKYMKVELWSNWNSSCNKTRFYTVANYATPMNIIAEFLQ